MTALQRSGPSVALLGPDGAGKSALLERLPTSFPFAVRTSYLGLYPAGTEPHRGPKGIGFVRRVGSLWRRAAPRPRRPVARPARRLRSAPTRRPTPRGRPPRARDRVRRGRPRPRSPGARPGAHPRCSRRGPPRPQGRVSGRRPRGRDGAAISRSRTISAHGPCSSTPRRPPRSSSTRSSIGSGRSGRGASTAAAMSDRRRTRRALGRDRSADARHEPGTNRRGERWPVPCRTSCPSSSPSGIVVAGDAAPARCSTPCALAAGCSPVGASAATPRRRRRAVGRRGGRIRLARRLSDRRSTRSRRRSSSGRRRGRSSERARRPDWHACGSGPRDRRSRPRTARRDRHGGRAARRPWPRWPDGALPSARARRASAGSPASARADRPRRDARGGGPVADAAATRRIRRPGSTGLSQAADGYDPRPPRGASTRRAATTRRRCSCGLRAARRGPAGRDRQADPGAPVQPSASSTGGAGPAPRSAAARTARPAAGSRACSPSGQAGRLEAVVEIARRPGVPLPPALADPAARHGSSRRSMALDRASGRGRGARRPVRRSPPPSTTLVQRYVAIHGPRRDRGAPRLAASSRRVAVGARRCRSWPRTAIRHPQPAARARTRPIVGPGLGSV